MTNAPSAKNTLQRLPYIGLAILLAGVLGSGIFGAMPLNTVAPAQAAAQEGSTIYLPMVVKSENPAGSYDCIEYEFGMIWAGETITLNPDGTSLYDYYGNIDLVVTGTWSYSFVNREVKFTNFRWLTATHVLTDRLWVSHYLPDPDFDIALSCLRQ